MPRTSAASGSVAAEAGDDEAMPGGRRVDPAVRQIDAATDAAARAQRRLQARVCQPVSSVMIATAKPVSLPITPPAARGASSNGMSRPPACQVRPLSRLLTHTSAGANRAPIDLVEVVFGRLEDVGERTPVVARVARRQLLRQARAPRRRRLAR